MILLIVVLLRIQVFASSEISTLLCGNLNEDLPKVEYSKYFSNYFRETIDVEKNNTFFKGLRKRFGKCKSSRFEKDSDKSFFVNLQSERAMIRLKLFINGKKEITGLWVDNVETSSRKLEEKVDYVCSSLKKGAELNYEKNFDKSFIEAVSEETVKSIFSNILKEHGECKSVDLSVIDEFSGTFITMHRSDLKFTISIDPKNYKIIGLLYKGVNLPKVKIESTTQLKKLLENMPGDTQILFKELGGKEIISRNLNQPFALGSAFKLYILLALDEKISKGEASWDDLLEIKEEFKSLPSGEMQNLKAGEKRTLFFFARKMIEISDNTATDHLLQFVGREVVEKLLKRLGVVHSGNSPFLSTMEMFRTRAFFKPADAKKYESSSREEKLEMLKSLSNKPYEEFIKAIQKWGNNPLYIDKIEWFSSANEMCNLFEVLNKRESEEVRKILAYNTPFVSKDGATYAGYKGGSEPGVITMNYLLEKNDKSFCFIFGQNNTKKALNQDYFFSVTEGSLEYLLNKKGKK
ncbi:serine hydrolase [Halobacteriovorax sp. JY17]|uniref:serine hydrolase n=1 Tax=Halobacteriovorax sp. JY17 TaxID=2014617 RepID=UPI0025BDACB7|nr:serine hydrolase [Halobacteriovorax sp. JY17]